MVRHYLALSQRNFGVDTGFYPLGSCTMKYNPKVNEQIARLPGFAETHPLQDPETVQGNLALMFELQQWLAEIGGFAGVSLQPSAGAHGEFTGLLMMRAYHRERGDLKRTRILIPDSAHGTNPASTTMAGFTAVELPSDARGNVDLEAVRAACDDTVAGIMITNPNTLGLFEEHIERGRAAGARVRRAGLRRRRQHERARRHRAARRSRLRRDALQSAQDLRDAAWRRRPGLPVRSASRRGSKDFLPGPVIESRATQADGARYVLAMPPKSIGRVSTFFGNFGMFVRAYAYIRRHGAAGLRANSEHAVLNANYLRVKLRDAFTVPFDRINMHEFVCRGAIEGTGVRALDVSKRLLDYGFHPPTNYFPLIVPEALMIEPTETESKPTLDAFVAAMQAIAQEAQSDPALVKGAPHETPVRRLDEVKAARELVLTDRAKTPRRRLRGKSAHGRTECGSSAQTHAALRRCTCGSARAWCRSPATTCRCNIPPASSRSTCIPAPPPACSTFRTWARSRCARAPGASRTPRARSRRWCPATSSGSPWAGSATRCSPTPRAACSMT